jgi:hypothetical protein
MKKSGDKKNIESQYKMMGVSVDAGDGFVLLFPGRVSDLSLVEGNEFLLWF